MSVPNQRKVKIADRDFKDRKLFARMHIEALQLASKTLSGSAIKLWIAIASNQDGYQFDLSKENMKKDWGIPESSYKRAVNDLIDEKYLVPIREGSNIYIFYEFPQEDQNEPVSASEDQNGPARSTQDQNELLSSQEDQNGLDSRKQGQNEPLSSKLVQNGPGKSIQDQNGLDSLQKAKIEYNGFVF